MNDQFDALQHAEHARQVQALATAARAAYEKRLVEDGTRLGLERDQAARRAHAAEYEKAAAELQARREVRIANEADKAAAELERKAPNSSPWRADAEELREQAAVHRARAEVARQRAHAADKEADRLEWTIQDNKRTVEALEAQMSSTDRMKAIEDSVDTLEFHARNAQVVAAAQVRLDDLETRIVAANERGETAMVAKLTQQAVEQRGLITVISQGRLDGGGIVDPARLAEIGIELPAGVLDPPGFQPTFPGMRATTTDAPSAEGSLTPTPTPNDPTFEDATTDAPAAETTEPEATPSDDEDVVTGKVAVPPEAPATNDTSAAPVEESTSSEAPLADPAPDVPSTPAAVEPEMPVEAPQVDYDADTTPFIEPEDPSTLESEDVLVDAG